MLQAYVTELFATYLEISRDVAKKLLEAQTERR